MSSESLPRPAPKSVFAIDPIELDGVREGDKIIVLLGRTGAGKSNFIEQLASKDLKISSFSGTRGTNDLTLYRIHDHPIWNDHIVLADTPGFQDTTMSEYGAIKTIRKWIEDEKAPQLHALFYIDRITDAIKGTDKQCWNLFTNLCGKGAAIRACLVTTAWDLVFTDSMSVRAEKRRKQLQTHWKPYLEEGLQSFEFHNTQESATNILMVALGPVNRPIGSRQNRLKVIQFVLENIKFSLIKPPVEKYIFCLLEDRFKTIVQELAETEKLLLSDPTVSRERAKLKTLWAAKEQLQSEMEEFAAARPLLRKIIRWFISFWTRPSPQATPPDHHHLPITVDVPEKPPTPIPSSPNGGEQPNADSEGPDIILPPDQDNPTANIPPEPTPATGELPDAQPDHDVVLLVCGPTGVGKTAFIGSCLNNRHLEERGHHSIGDGTKDVKIYTINLSETGRRLVLVDTPGFDDPNRPDSEVLMIIARYLEATYREGRLLDGVIYFHRITDIRFDAGASLALNIFRKMYGRMEAHDKLALVTTMWNNVRPEVRYKYEVKESELKENAWGNFLQRKHPALVAQYDTSDGDMGRTSALNVVSGLLQNSIGGELRLQIQRELVDEGKKLPRTEAGKAAFTLAETYKYYVKDMAS